MSLYLARESTWAPFTTCSGGWCTADAIVCSAGSDVMAGGVAADQAPGEFGLVLPAGERVGGRAGAGARRVADGQAGVQSICEGPAELS